ncbi:MAG: cation diffusion facilitator family transporter, partial [Mariprofundaceae bacterium]|nr:cation diffusion facilitator family transporter [Mariprofundaceae bacterium]
MHEHHGHSPHKLNAALVLTAVFAVVELAGGWISGSLALLADAVHMVSDVAALGLAVLAGRIAARPAHAGMSYGYGRARVLAAQMNGFGLWFVAGWIVWVAVGRISSPPQVQGGLMLGVAMAGLVVNIIILRWLHGGRDLNIRAAYWHVLSDLLGSVAAVVTGLVIVWTGWMLIDPILSLVVTLILVWGGWRLVR